MIVRFRHKGLERYFMRGDVSGISTKHAGKLRRVLALLNVSKEPSEMNLPGFKLHQLKGERKGQWAISISGNLRLIFEFDDENATNVDLVDYH